MSIIICHFVVFCRCVVVSAMDIDTQSRFDGKFGCCHSNSDIIKIHWGRVTHRYIGKLTIIGSDNGLPPGRRQAIIWNNAGVSLIRPWGTNFDEMLIATETFTFMSRKCRPFWLGLNVLKLHNFAPLLHMGKFKQKDGQGQTCRRNCFPWDLKRGWIHIHREVVELWPLG